MFQLLLTIFLSFQLINCNYNDNKNNQSSKSEITRYENFSLPNANGKIYSLEDFNNSKAIVIMFIATQCPVSNEYNSRMVNLYNDYSDKGIAFIGINSNKQESVEEIKEHNHKNEFKFTVLKDWDNIIADKFEATVTPEVFVLNPNYELLYHGRIDNSRRIEEVKSHDLRQALDEILAGKEITVKTTKAFGCTIKRVEK